MSYESRNTTEIIGSVFCYSFVLMLIRCVLDSLCLNILLNFVHGSEVKNVYYRYNKSILHVILIMTEASGPFKTALCASRVCNAFYAR